MLSCVIRNYKSLFIFLPRLPVRLPRPAFLIVRMSGEPTELEKSIKEVLKKFMDDRDMSKGVHESSTRGLQASPSTRRLSGRTNPVTE